MEFQIPQFITTETGIVGPLNFRQFMILATAGLVVFLLFFVIKNLFIFTTVALLIGAAAMIFSFGSVHGQIFPVVFKNSVMYFFRPRVYVWRKKGMPVKVFREKQAVRLIAEDATEKKKLTMGKESQVRKLWTQLETSGKQQN